MHGIKLFLASALLGVSLNAAAEPPQIDVAHEIPARTITLPATDTGTVVVQACSACPTYRFNATATTFYRVGQFTVSLTELRAAFAQRPNDIVLLELTADHRSVVQISMPPETPAR
jgi:hypothetical protein